LCQARKIDCEYVVVTDKKPGDGIVCIVNEMNIQLIVMGSRGLSASRRTILGSVSDYVLHHAQIPICIIPREYALNSRSSIEVCPEGANE
uniref:Usp domain-containing protein n=1 Tax=Rodentolepis nana TaxID=102285 RepID=A0A0R3TJ42_RODNA